MLSIHIEYGRYESLLVISGVERRYLGESLLPSLADIWDLQVQ